MAVSTLVLAVVAAANGRFLTESRHPVVSQHWSQWARSHHWLRSGSTSASGKPLRLCKARFLRIAAIRGWRSIGQFGLATAVRCNPLEWLLSAQSRHEPSTRQAESGNSLLSATVSAACRMPTLQSSANGPKLTFFLRLWMPCFSPRQTFAPQSGQSLIVV